MPVLRGSDARGVADQPETSPAVRFIASGSKVTRVPLGARWQTGPQKDSRGRPVGGTFAWLASLLRNRR
jgi:hypothetical protein